MFEGVALGKKQQLNAEADDHLRTIKHPITLKIALTTILRLIIIFSQVCIISSKSQLVLIYKLRNMNPKMMPINPKMMMIRVVAFIFLGFFEIFFEERWGIALELLSFMMVIPTMISLIEKYEIRITQTFVISMNSFGSWWSVLEFWRPYILGK